MDFEKIFTTTKKRDFQFLESLNYYLGCIFFSIDEVVDWKSK